MTVFEITAPDGRVLEIEGEKAPSETDLDEIFKTIPIKTNPVSDNQAALENIKSADTDDVGMTLTEKFNKLRQDAAKYAKNIPEKQNGMSWLEYAKLRKKYDEDWNLQTPELNPLKAMWKNSVIGMMSENLYRGQKDRRAMQYTDNKEVLTEIPAKAQSDWKEKGQIKAGEALMRSDWSRVIPFAGSMSGLNESFDIKSIIDKKNKGEELSKKEVERLNGYILDVAEQNQRGISFGGKLIQGALELPSFAGEFMATGGIATLGKQAVQKTVTKGLQNAAQKEIGKRLTAGLIEGAAGAVTRTSIGMPQRVVENYGMRRLHESLGITDKGQVLLETADEKPYSTFLKAWGDTVIENWSEEMGGGIAEAAGLSLKGAGKLVSPLQEKLFSRNTRAAFIKAIRKLRPNATVKDIMTRAGFNGILGEMGEERAGDVLRVMFGIDDRQDVSTFEKICEAINPGAEELLLELGLFSIPGSMSFVASKVANHLRAKNISEEDISDYMRLSSELEKESLLSNIAQNNDLAITENFESNLRDIKNHYFTQNLNAGLEKTEALATAEIEANAAAIMSKQYGISLDEAKDRLALNVQSLTDEQAAEQMQADTKVLQGGIEMEVEKHNQVQFDRANIEDNFGDSVENITTLLKNDVLNVITENNLDDTEFNLQDARIYGSYAKGKNNEKSDLDIIVQYSGNMREDDAFNMFADAGLVIVDKNGNEIKVDVNPINIDKSGTIEDNLNYFDSLEPKFQSIESAGANANNINEAVKEWAEKGVESKYFKKWFGDSVVKHSSTDKPIVVYHGTDFNFSEFRPAGDFNFPDAVYFSSKKSVAKSYTNTGNIIQCYLKLENPYVANANGAKYNDYYNNLMSDMDYAVRNGYDGVIIRNIRDDWGQNKRGGTVADTYIVFNPEQIKSINNQGTFDESNPNIYYQSAMKRSEFTSFKDFYIDVLNNKQAKEKKQYNHLTGDGINIRIPHDTVIHDDNRHKLTADEWQELLDNIDDVSDAALSKQKSSYDGKSVLLKINTQNNTYGVVLETFAKNNPLISTAFIDTEQNIDNWIKNEAIPSGTKTSFLGTRLNNIIKYVQPKFKPFVPKAYFQSAYHGTPHKFDEFSLDAIGTGEGAQAHGWGLYFAENKEISEEYRKALIQGGSFGSLLKEIKIGNLTLGHILNRLGFSSYDMSSLLSDTMNNFQNENAKKVIAKLNEFINLWENLPNSSDWQKEMTIKYKKLISQLEKNKIENTKKGQLFEVDIPDSDVLLDEDKSFSEQSDFIKNALKELDEKEDLGLMQYEIESYTTGKEIYERIGKLISTRPQRAEKTSKLLNQYGIKGITYDGQQDGRCYVIFDDKAINVLKTYYQGMDDNIDSNIQNARGFTYRRFNFDGTVKDNLIVLLKNKSDKSTLLHEFAHVYLTTLNDLARDNAKAKADLLVVNKWLGYNGVEYTDFQHEKFANGFVAYVKTGKAPTYGLKKAFEQFKRWLNELYNELVYSDEIELDNDAKAVFDELLGGKSQEAVAEQIKDFVKKAENNALLRLRAEKVEKRELPQNMLTEYQRKYRDTAYDIIWYALSHIKKKEGGFEEPLVKDKRQLYMLFGNDSKVSSKNKGIMKQAEKLEFVLGEVDDVFSGNDGFLSEWGEFFNDPGIGQNEGADTTLALTALDVIKQRKYLYETEKAFEGISEEDIKRAQYELDYILDEFKNNSDRDLVVAGFFDWIENQPEFLQEDFITKWENSTNEIERYEALTKFEQAKEDLKLYAAALKGFGDYSWQFAEYARKILKRLDFMTEHDKAKIFDKLKDFNSFREIERNLDDVMDYAETLNDVSLRRNLADTIVNEVKRTTPIIKNGTKKTRYDYRTNKLFERLRYLNKLKQEEIQDLYDAYVNGEIERRASQFDENGTITGKTESYFEDIENSFLQFKANGMYYNSTELLQTLLSKIQNAKFTGKIARDEMDFEQRMNQENWINSCAQAIETHRGKSGKIEEIYSMEANFDSMLSMVFDDDIKNQFSLDDLYAQVDGRVGKDREEILNKIAEIFGFSGALKGAMLNNKFIEMANEKFTIKQRYANKERWGWEPVTLSKMEVLYYYIQAKNPVSYSMLTDMGDETHSAKGQFDKFEFDELLKNLSDQEKLMGDALQIAAEKYYNDLNKYHIKKHHIDLGKATCYFPRKSELKEINELDLFNQYTEKSTNPKFVKMRSAGPSIRIAPANPVNVLFNHIQKANTIIIMGDKLDLMNKVFRDNDLGQKIKSVFGDTVYKEFMQHVTENLYDGQAKALSNAEGIISKLMSNIIGVPMFIKPQVGLKQVLGLINYGVGDEYVGTLEWMKAFTNVIKNPKSAIDFMMQDEYLKDRLTRGNMNEAMKNQIDNKLSSKLSLLTDYFSLNMRYGDLFNLTLGGKAYVDVLMSKGYTKTQAFELFRKKTISDQQSSIASTLSNLQRNSKNNPFARLLFAYQNTPHQYFRICANAIIKAKRGRMSKSQAVKTVFIYWWFLPFIFNMAGSLSPITLIATGDPDELINDMLIACLGSISCIPFFGEMARALFAGVTGSEYFGNKDWFTRANEAIVRPINKFRKGNLRFEDILKSLEIFAQGLGIPLEEIDTQLEAFGDYANGDFGKGVIKTLGYSRYRADAVTGDK